MMYPAVLLPARRVVGKLLAVWRRREFWLQEYFLLHWISLTACYMFWVSSIIQVWQGGPVPLLSWMISAYSSVFLSTRVNFRVFAGEESVKGQVTPAMLLLQFALIIVFNGVMIIVMAYRNIGFTAADLRIAAVAILGTLITKLVAWRMKERLHPAWRLSGYAIAQKSAPQVVQAVVIFTTSASLGEWSIAALLVQGLSRLVLSVLTKRKNPGAQGPRAQFWNALTDAATVALIGLAVIRDVAAAS